MHDEHSKVNHLFHGCCCCSHHTKRHASCKTFHTVAGRVQRLLSLSPLSLREVNVTVAAASWLSTVECSYHTTLPHIYYTSSSLSSSLLFHSWCNLCSWQCDRSSLLATAAAPIQEVGQVCLCSLWSFFFIFVFHTLMCLSASLARGNGALLLEKLKQMYPCSCSWSESD